MLQQLLACCVCLCCAVACGQGYSLSKLEGRWQGSWKVKALGKHGDAAITFRSMDNAQMEAFLELEGGPFDGDVPYAQFLRGPKKGEGVVLRGALQTMGNVRLEIDEEGAIDGEANPSSVGRIDLHGGVKETELHMEFNFVLFPGDVDLEYVE